MADIFFTEDISGDDMNPYEAVTLASREARRVNQLRLVGDLPEETEKPTTYGLSLLANKEIGHSYVEEASDQEIGEQEDVTSQEKPDTSGD